MIQVSSSYAAALRAVQNEPVEVYSLFLDSGLLTLSDQAFASSLPYVVSRSTIKRYRDGQFDEVTITLSNVDLAMAEIILSTDIEGRILKIAKTDRNADDSITIFHGQMHKPSVVDETTVQIVATQIIGSIDQNVPSRNLTLMCPWRFKGTECGPAPTGSSCDKSWSGCVANANTLHFGGSRFVALSELVRAHYTDGSYRWFNATRSNDLSPNAVMPIILGRRLVPGIVVQHEYRASETYLVAMLGVGELHGLLFCLCNNELKAGYYKSGLTGEVHQWANFYTGALEAPEVDWRFPDGVSYHLLGHLGVTHFTPDGSQPAVEALVLGIATNPRSEIFGVWSANPVDNTRAFMSLPSSRGGMGIPAEWFDDAACNETAVYCDEAIDDWTNSQRIYLPQTMPDGWVVGQNYRRYQSTCVIKEPGAEASAWEGPYLSYDDYIADETASLPSISVKRFTLNAYLSDSSAAVDVLYKRILPAFRGFIRFNKEGKIQICSERPVPSAKITAAVELGVSIILCDASSKFTAGDKVILGVLTPTAEVATIQSIQSGALTVTVPTAHAHANNDQIYRIAMAFDDSNTTGTFTYPMGDRQSSINRVTVKFPNAPLGYAIQELNINDYDHQDKIRKVNNEDVDWGDSIDNYFQAYRVGQWQLAKYRDLGKFVSFTADISATPIEIGDVIAVSAVEVGLAAVPFQVVEMGYEPNDEVSIIGQLFSNDIYNDDAPRATAQVPVIFGGRGAGLIPPQPTFDLSAPGDGTLLVEHLDVPTLVGTGAVDAALLVIYSVDEVAAPTTFAITAAMTSGELLIHVAPGTSLGENTYFQVEAELMRIVEPGTAADTYVIDRALAGTINVAHAAQEAIVLDMTMHVLPLGTSFFSDAGHRAAQHKILFPNRRIASVNMLLRNERGTGLAQSVSYLANGHNGLHTYSGATLVMQSAGVLAVESNACGTLAADQPRVVRSIQAFVDVAPTGGTVQVAVRVDGTVVATLVFLADQLSSMQFVPATSIILPAGARVSADILSVPTATNSYPGKNLTVQVRV